MLILQRHLFQHGLLASLLSLAVFLGVISALFLAELLGDAAQGRLPGASVVLLLILRLPEGAMLVGPLALMTGLLLTLGRMHEQSELVVVRASGAGFAGTFAPVLVLAASWAGLLLLVAGWLVPMAVERTAGLMADAARHAMVAGLQAGQFERLEQGRLILYVGSVDRRDGQLRDIFLQHAGPDGMEILAAARGRLWVDPDDDSRYLSLIDGHQVQHGEELDQADLRDMRFARNDIRLPAPIVHTGEDNEVVSRLPALWRAQTPAERREWHWRLAAPLAALILGLMAVPLADRLPRQGRFGNLVLALGLYLVYSNAVHAGLIMMEQRSSTQGPGLWPLHVAVALLAVGLWWRQWRRW